MAIESYVESGWRVVRGKDEPQPTRPQLGMLYLLLTDTLRKAKAECRFDGWHCEDGSRFDYTDVVFALSMAGWDIRPKDVLWCWNRAVHAHTGMVTA